MALERGVFYCYVASLYWEQKGIHNHGLVLFKGWLNDLDFLRFRNQYNYCLKCKRHDAKTDDNMVVLLEEARMQRIRENIPDACYWFCKQMRIVLF